jgi:hypothetical protein
MFFGGDEDKVFVPLWELFMAVFQKSLVLPALESGTGYVDAFVEFLNTPFDAEKELEIFYGNLYGANSFSPVP